MMSAWPWLIRHTGLAAMIVVAGPAAANFTAAKLADMAAAPPANAALPADLALRDENGRRLSVNNALGGVPAVVVFADYTCRTLCGPIIEFAAAGLARSGLRPGADYRLLAIGLDPRDGIDEARTMRGKHIDAASPLNGAAIFLTADERSIRAATAALGLTYAYDQEYDQYAHPAAIYVVDTVGRVRRVLSPFGLDGSDLRLALVEAGNGAVGNFVDRIHLLCYRYDAAKGIYTERITVVLGYAAGATLLLLLSGLSVLLMRERRKAAP
jgi:protein SCO1/2